MKKRLITAILITTTFSQSIALQICRNEAEIPSTAPDSKFIDNANGTISDKVTGLMWQKCTVGLSGSDCQTGNETLHTWQQALDEANSSTTGSHLDWRLPNVKELESLVELQCYNPAINLSYFPNTVGVKFWTSSPKQDQTNYSWYVEFFYGLTDGDWRDFNPKVIRLVR